MGNNQICAEFSFLNLKTMHRFFATILSTFRKQDDKNTNSFEDSVFYFRYASIHGLRTYPWFSDALYSAGPSRVWELHCFSIVLFVFLDQKASDFRGDCVAQFVVRRHRGCDEHYLLIATMAGTWTNEAPEPCSLLEGFGLVRRVKVQRGRFRRT